VQITLKSTPLSSIHLEEDTYFFAPESSPGFLSTQLIESIQEVGILHPPLIQQINDREEHIVISGFKRLAILKKISPTARIHCLVLPATCSPSELLIILYHHWVADRQPSIVEQARYFKKAYNFIDQATLLSFAQQLGHKPTMRVVDDLISLLDLEQSVVLALHKGTLQPRTARKIRSLDKLEQNTVAGLIAAYKLGGSKQQKMVDLGMELSMRKKVSWRDIGEKWLVEEGDSDRNIPQQGTKFLEWLFEQCHPRSCGAESEFSEFVRTLNLPSKATISHAPFFESDELYLTIKYKNRMELQKEFLSMHLTDTP